MNFTNFDIFWPLIVSIIILIILHINHYKHYKKFLTNWQSILLSHFGLGFYLYFWYYFYNSKIFTSYSILFGLLNYLLILNTIGYIYKMRTKNTPSKYYNSESDLAK
jgi:hypothetical protein